MAKKQSRRSVSISREAYERLRAYCETNNVPMSQFVENQISSLLGRSAAREDEENARRTAERFFTF